MTGFGEGVLQYLEGWGGGWGSGCTQHITIYDLTDDILLLLIFSARSEDCKQCDSYSSYVRHVFSLVPGSLAAISLLTVLLSQALKLTCKPHSKAH